MPPHQHFIGTSPYHFYDKLQSTACMVIWSLPRFLWNEIHRAKVWNVSHSFARLYFISISFLFHSYSAFYFIVFPTLFHSDFILTQLFISLLFHCLPRAISLVFHCCFIACLGQHHDHFTYCCCHIIIFWHHAQLDFIMGWMGQADFGWPFNPNPNFIV